MGISASRLETQGRVDWGTTYSGSSDWGATNGSTGDQLSYDPENGLITNHTNGKTFQSVPAAPFVAEVEKAGGLMNFVRDKIAKGEPIG